MFLPTNDCFYSLLSITYGTFRSSYLLHYTFYIQSEFCSRGIKVLILPFFKVHTCTCNYELACLDCLVCMGHLVLILTLPNMKRAGVAQPLSDNTFTNSPNN